MGVCEGVRVSMGVWECEGVRVWECEGVRVSMGMWEYEGVWNGS